jgi:hypothetical protein
MGESVGQASGTDRRSLIHVAVILQTLSAVAKIGTMPENRHSEVIFSPSCYASIQSYTARDHLQRWKI